MHGFKVFTVSKNGPDSRKTTYRRSLLKQKVVKYYLPESSSYMCIFVVQGTAESMKWLTELMESSHSSLEVLPVPCLCEFLMASYKEQGDGGSSDADSADPSSHRGMYKRRKTAHDKV